MHATLVGLVIIKVLIEKKESANDQKRKKEIGRVNKKDSRANLDIQVGMFVEFRIFNKIEIGHF